MEYTLNDTFQTVSIEQLSELKDQVAKGLDAVAAYEEPIREMNLVAEQRLEDAVQMGCEKRKLFLRGP